MMRAAVAAASELHSSIRFGPEAQPAKYMTL
jgi:hypothetical protein